MISRVGNYDLVRLIGEGAFSRVFLGRHVITGHQVAVKVVPRESLASPGALTRFNREVALLKQMHHPFIAELYDIVHTPEATFLVLELLDGGSLLDHINSRGRLCEDEAKKYFIQLVCALDYLHNELHVAHRDIKAENILFDRYGNIRLVDFGLSGTFTKERPSMTTSCGSPAYAAPEMIQGQPYTKATDMWSAGIVLYAMVCGSLPFEDENVQTLLQKVVYTEARYPDCMSLSLIDLLRRLLAKLPEERITLSRVQEHPWLANSRYGPLMTAPLSDTHAGEQVDKEIVEKMQGMGVDCKTLTQELIQRNWTDATAVYHMIQREKAAAKVNGMMESLGAMLQPSGSAPIAQIGRMSMFGDAFLDSMKSRMMVLAKPEKLFAPRRMSRPVTIPRPSVLPGTPGARSCTMVPKL